MSPLAIFKDAPREFTYDRKFKYRPANYSGGYSMRDVANGSPFRYPKNFIFQAGQPAEITEAYREAMGMLPDGLMRLAAEIAPTISSGDML